MLPRGRPHSQQYRDPDGYGLNFNQYPQHFPYGPFGGQARQPPENFNRHRRDRARPRSQYSYYDESLNSNVSGNPLNLRGGFSHSSSGTGRGGGVISSSTYLPSSKPQLRERRQNESVNVHKTYYHRSYNRSEASGYEQNTGNQNQQTKEDKNENRMKRDNQGDLVQFTIYFCPKCGENYSSQYTNNRHVGKIPLILQCTHTMCQECIYQDLKNNRVNCPICLTDSILTQEQTPVCQSDMQHIFLPNFYVLGVLSYYKSTGSYLKNLENMSFVSPELKKLHASLPDPCDRCCFATCSKEATMFCPACEGIYCSDCCTVVHKITKKMMSHAPIPRRKDKFTLTLENCGEHSSMQVEFFCKTCDLTACCYCVLDKHTDHERVPLYHLNTVEMEEFKRLKKVAEKALKEVLATQKKATKLANFDTRSVKKDMCQYFADCHAKLESLEKKLCNELEQFKANNRGLDNIQTSLEASAEQLKILISFNEDKIGDKKLNLRGALDKLRNIENIPRFLLNESGQSEPVRFIANTATINDLEDDFVLEKCEDSEYRLVTEKELPEDYAINNESDSEINEAINGILRSDQNTDLLKLVSKSNDSSVMVPVSATSSLRSNRAAKIKEPTKKKIDMERVEVQHINSMDSFFVQSKKDQSKLGQLNKDIENYVKMGGAQTVQQPQLNDLYLALYVNESHNKNKKEQKWCRARLTEIKNSARGPVYELFFIDYGKTQIVDGNRIRDIPAFLTQKNPFAIECMLHNPMNVNWNKKAHYSLAKILNGKDVYMMEKCYNNGIYEVDLMIASSDGGVTSVTDILVHAHNSVDAINDDSTSLDGSASASIRKDGYYPILKLFPNSKKFTKNQKEKVTIATVIDPQNVFVHLVQYQDAFKSMNSAIKKAYKNGKSAGCIPIEGTYVLVEYKDPVRSNWHRAFIKSVDINCDQVHVLLVDWGLNVVVQSRNIRALQESFTKLECQAILVKLAHIAPYNKQHIWPSYATNFLHNYHKSQDVLKMIVQENQPELEVALFDISGNVDICLNALMVENNLADSTGPISSKVEWPQFEISNPEFSEEDGLMSSLLKKVDEQIDDDSDEDVSEVKKRQVDIVKVDAPDLIWLKFLEFKNREREMFRELQIHYSQEQKVKTAWEVGEQCVTEVGHEYARGKILNVEGEDYKVYLLDKVTEITAPIGKIYVYDKYFAKYPQTVTKSHLANIRPAGDTGKWSISSVEALQEIFAKQKRIYASKAQESDCELSKKSLPLDMWYGLVIQGGPLDPDRMKYVSINNSLVKLGFAYKITRPVTPKPLAVTEKEGSKSLLSAILTTAAVSVESSETSAPNEQDNISPLESQEQSGGNAPVSDATKGEVNSFLGVGAVKKVPKKIEDQKGVKTVKLLVEGEPESDGRGFVNTSKNSKTLSQGGKEKTSGDEEDKVTIEPTEDKENDKTDDEQPIENSNEKKARKYFDDEDPVFENWNAVIEQELGETEAAPTDLHLQEQAAKNIDLISNNSEDSPHYKTEVAIDDWLPPFRLTQKDFRARVTCVETGGHLYLHEEAMDIVYHKMEANIKEYFDSSPPEIVPHKWKPGELCTIKYTDGNWYRGKILKVKNSEELSVFMIDFGSDHNVSPDVLFREILYTDIEPFAIKVKLDKVYSKSKTWLTSDYDHFHNLVTDWCRVVVKGPLDVELPLVDIHNENGDYVNQKLVELCPNLSRSWNFPMQMVDEEDDTIVIESFEDQGSYADEMLMDNVHRELDTKYQASLKTFYLPDSEETLKYSIQPLPKKLLEGKKVLMEIGGILNFDKIVLRMPGGDIGEEMYDLITELQDTVDNLPNLKEFTIGTPCLAPFSEDGVWYRAQITCTKGTREGVVDVMYVDYGNSESIPVENVKVMRLDYLKLPRQSWEAAVNVALKDGADVNNMMQLMNLLDGKRKYVKVVKENPLTVDLYEKNEVLCYETLISNGTLERIHSDEVSP